MDRNSPATFVLLVLSALAPAAWPADAGANPDRTLKDAAGREVSRTRTLADGTIETSRVTWAGQVKQAVVTERTDATGRIVHREWERLDGSGRLVERRVVDLDAQGLEHGWRKVYTYDDSGTPRERTFAIK